MAEVKSMLISPNGGEFRLMRGVHLVVPRGLLWRNTQIRAEMDEDEARIVFRFSSTRRKAGLPKPVGLVVTREAVANARDLTLYSDTGEAIEPDYDGVVVVWLLDSLTCYHLLK